MDFAMTNIDTEIDKLALWDFKVTKGASVLSKTSTKEASIGIARAIAAKLGSSVYDMQLLI